MTSAPAGGPGDADARAISGHLREGLSGTRRRMSLINPAILYGLGLALIPIILHFLLRTKPKKLLFPALKLLQARRTMNVRRLRLRHIWLLLLRIAVIGLLVLAIARPSLPAADYT